MIKLEAEHTALLGANESLVPYAERDGRQVYQVKFRVDGATPVQTPDGKRVRLDLRLPHTKRGFDYNVSEDELPDGLKVLAGETLNVLVVEDGGHYKTVGIAKQRKWS